MIETLKKYTVGPGLVLSSVFGFFVGKLMYKPVQQITESVKLESFQSESIHEDGSRTLERKASNQKPKMERSTIPGEVKRIVETKIQPTQPGPVTVELVQSEDQNGTHVTIKAEGGTILSGSDVVIPYKIVTVKNLHWNAQILAKWDRQGRKWGGLLGYEKGRIIGSVAVFPRSQEVFAGIGIKF